MRMYILLCMCVLVTLCLLPCGIVAQYESSSSTGVYSSSSTSDYTSSSSTSDYPSSSSTGVYPSSSTGVYPSSSTGVYPSSSTGYSSSSGPAYSSSSSSYVPPSSSTGVPYSSTGGYSPCVSCAEVIPTCPYCNPGSTCEIVEQTCYNCSYAWCNPSTPCINCEDYDRWACDKMQCPCDQHCEMTEKSCEQCPTAQCVPNNCTAYANVYTSAALSNVEPCVTCYTEPTCDNVRCAYGSHCVAVPNSCNKCGDTWCIPDYCDYEYGSSPAQPCIACPLVYPECNLQCYLGYHCEISPQSCDTCAYPACVKDEIPDNYTSTVPCVKCPDLAPSACASVLCPNDTACVVVPTTCTSCSRTVCQPKAYNQSCIACAVVNDCDSRCAGQDCLWIQPKNCTECGHYQCVPQQQWCPEVPEYGQCQRQLDVHSNSNLKHSRTDDYNLLPADTSLYDQNQPVQSNYTQQWQGPIACYRNPCDDVTQLTCYQSDATCYSAYCYDCDAHCSCNVDADCYPNQYCRAISLQANAPKACFNYANEGELCDVVTDAAGGGRNCAVNNGLQCVAYGNSGYGTCRKSCSETYLTGCDQGYYCSDDQYCIPVGTCHTTKDCLTSNNQYFHQTCGIYDSFTTCQEGCCQHKCKYKEKVW